MKILKNTKNKEINLIYTQIKDILDKARSKAYKAVNFVMVEAYWNIGRVIVAEEQKGEQRAKYGAELIKIYLKK